MISNQKAAELLAASYGITGILTRLGGDRDANFRVESKGGQCYVFKVMHSSCTEQSVALQCATLNHLKSSTLNLPTVVSTLNGDNWRSVDHGGEDHIIWVLNWCAGTLLAEYSPHSDTVITSFGRVLAQLDNALQDFPPPGRPAGSYWDLTRAGETSDFIADIRDEETRHLVRDVLEKFTHHTLPVLDSLPKGLIHNDANDYNVLVNKVGGIAEVDGVFDFGDLSWQPVICDVAIALAYLLLEKDQPLAVCATFLKGYTLHRPLTRQELVVLFDLIRTRLSVSIAISSHRQLTEPDDAYLAISQQPAIRALKNLQGITSEEAGNYFVRECQLPG